VAERAQCMHLTAFRTRRLNLLVGFLGSIPAFSFFEHELLMHKDHHTYTGDPRRDTELLSGGESHQRLANTAQTGE
jgi:fatty acid desaturase